MALSPAQYRAMLPPLGDLLAVYKLDPEVAFALYRPVMSQVTPPLLALAPEEGEIAEVPAAAPAAGEGSAPPARSRYN